MALLIGVCFFLHLLKLSAGSGFWLNIQNTHPVLHKLAIRYQRCLRRLEKAQLDLNFLHDCKKNQVYPKFERWKNITHLRKKKTQGHYLLLLLNDAIKDKKINIDNLTNRTLELKQHLSNQTTWMKFKHLFFHQSPPS